MIRINFNGSVVCEKMTNRQLDDGHICAVFGCSRDAMTFISMELKGINLFIPICDVHTLEYDRIDQRGL